jgi:8-oxo-dGTP pyrophosphatase MutT (NUDIX family)
MGDAVRIEHQLNGNWVIMPEKNKHQNLLFQRIAALLARRDCKTIPDAAGRTRASVALLLRQTDNDMEILFIQRASHDQDPWSGHIAFPGGKWEEGELVCQTARRETLEEIGIDLEHGCYLGRLSDIIGTNLPVWVSCCVYGIKQRIFEPVLNDEVSDVFWIRLSDVRDHGRHHLAPVAFGDRSLEVPAIRLPVEGKPVLWGITYRLVMQFLELLELLDRGVANSGDCCTLPELVELNEEELS